MWWCLFFHREFFRSDHRSYIYRNNHKNVCVYTPKAIIFASFVLSPSLLDYGGSLTSHIWPQLPSQLADLVKTPPPCRLYQIRNTQSDQNQMSLIWLILFHYADRQSDTFLLNFNKQSNLHISSNMFFFFFFFK